MLAVLLGSADKAEAALYSTVNHKARCDLVLAVGRRSNLDERSLDYLTYALGTMGDAADARNKLTHGLFKAEPYSGELLSIHRRPITKVPEITRRDILKLITDAIALCERATALLQSTVLAITAPELIDAALKTPPDAIARV